MRKRNNMKNTEKASLKSLKGLFKYLKPYRIILVISLIAVLIATILQVIGPDIIKKLTEEITKIFPKPIGQGTILDMDSVLRITITLVIMYGISLILNVIQNYFMSTITIKLSTNLRSDLSTKIHKVPLKYYDKTSVGDTISRVTNDVDTMSQTVNQSFASLVSAVIMFLGSIVMMFVTNYILAITAILASLIGFILMGVIIGKSQKYFVSQQKTLGELNGYIEEIYTNHELVKVYNESNNSIKEFEKINKSLYKSGWLSQFLSGLMMPIMSFIGNLGYVSVSVVGAILVLNHGVNISVIFAFMIYVRLFTNPLGQIAQGLNNLQLAAAASKRVFEFLDTDELEDETNKTLVLENPKGSVTFSNVSFGYDKDKQIIKDFSASIKPGQKVAIVGPTGAGKTTIVNLLMRFYETDSGSILLDEFNTKDIKRENVHDEFCMVLQDTWIIKGTIYENIMYSVKNVTNEDVIKASVKLGLDHFIRTLPKGYETILDEKSSISEGQKQLITIARAMIKNAPLLILDEATSSVDTRTEILIQKAMDELMKGRTSFIIAHRLSTIKNADLILVMKDGSIIEKGTHNELLELGKFYAELYNSQFE